MKLLMITGIGSAKDLASGKKGAFYNTLEEFHKYWTRIDIIVPKITKHRIQNTNKSQNTEYKTQTEILFGNVFLHISPWPLIFHPPFFIYKIMKLHKKVNFDLMTVHEFPPFYNGIGAWIVSIFTKIPYVLEIHHVPGHPRSANLKEDIYRNLMRWFIKFDALRATAVRVVNKKQTPEFLIKSRVPEKKIIYIPSMYINIEVFKPMGLPKEYDLIFVGRLEKNKGIDLLLEAASKLKTQILNFKLLIVGSGSLKNDLKFKIENLKLQDNVLLCGWAKDSREVAELINKSKILVMPSYNEGGPRVVAEALACGVPVLATPVGIVPDLLKNLPAGRQVASGGEIIDWDADDIVRKASELLNNPNKYQMYSHSGPEIAKQFERKETIKNYAEKLQNLIS